MKNSMLSRMFKSTLLFLFMTGIFISLNKTMPQTGFSFSSHTLPLDSKIEANQTKANSDDSLSEARKMPAQVKADSEKPLPIILLNKKNTLTFRQPVTELSVSKMQKKLLELSNELPKNETIYLVMFSPGGSVDAGNLFIDTASAIPQKVKTITIFAASMAYHMVQSLDERLILPSGVLMSHRARISGLDGEIPGEAVTRLKWIVRELEEMDKKVSKRLQMSFEDYREMIRDEYWVNGNDAVAERSADRTVLVRCGKEMSGIEEEELQTFFGVVVLKYSECPMITSPLGIEFKGRKRSAESDKFVYLLANNKNKFVQEYIITNKYRDFLK